VLCSKNKIHVFIDQYLADVTVLKKKLLSNYEHFKQLLSTFFSRGVKRDHAKPLQHGPIIFLHPRYGNIPVWTEHNPQKLIIQEASTEMTDNTKKRGRE